MEVNIITRMIIGCAINVHRQLGPGLLGSTYSTCLNYELINAGLQVQQELSLPLIYKDLYMDIGYRLDMLVEKML